LDKFLKVTKQFVALCPCEANSAFHPSGVGKWGPASAGKAKARMVHSVSGWTQGVQENCEVPWERIPDALEVYLRWGAIQIHVNLCLTLPVDKWKCAADVDRVKYVIVSVQWIDISWCRRHSGISCRLSIWTSQMAKLVTWRHLWLTIR